jgi:hypothetical protein
MNKAILSIACLVVVSLLGAGDCRPTLWAASPFGPGDQMGDTFFSGPELHTFDVQLGRAELEALRQSPRHYVAGTVTVAGCTYEEVGVRLKGTGTFQSIGRRPNLALKFNWKRPNQEFAGLTKLFLKNSLQDPSFFCELTASTAFAAAGLPVPRVTHARVRLNGRDLGLCVVNEAVNRRFLKRYFANPDGRLYEGAFRDVNVRLEQDSGPPGSSRELAALAAAAAIKDRSARAAALAELLDVEQFLNYLAVEMIVANWDGYAINQNNYRIYHDPASGRFVFIPHGLDHAIFETGLSLIPPRKALLTRALLDTPAERDAFRQRAARLLPKVYDPAMLEARFGASIARIQQGGTAEEAEWIEQRAAIVLRHVRERGARLREQIEGTRRQPVEFNAPGTAVLEGWLPKPDWNCSPVEKQTLNGKSLLALTATNRFCFSSWRRAAWLPPGRYRLEGLAATAGVQGLPSMTGSGAGVRVLGTMRGSGLTGSSDWTPVQHEFTVQEGCEYVELIAELRAYAGQAMFDLGKFRLTKVQP